MPEHNYLSRGTRVTPQASASEKKIKCFKWTRENICGRNYRRMKNKRALLIPNLWKKETHLTAAILGHDEVNAKANITSLKNVRIKDPKVGSRTIRLRNSGRDKHPDDNGSIETRKKVIDFRGNPQQRSRPKRACGQLVITTSIRVMDDDLLL